MLRRSLGLGACTLMALLATAHAQETQRFVAFDNATVQPAGPRPGDFGKIFFNVQGSANGEFASFGVADFQFDTCAATEIAAPRLDIVQSNAGFTTDGRYSIYLTDAVDVSIQPDDSPLTYQGGEGVASIDPLLTGLQLLGEFEFVEIGDGAVDTVPLAPSPDATAAIVAALNAGERLRLVLAPEDPAVSATYAGQDNFDGPAPALVFEADCDGGEIVPGSASVAAFDNATVQATGPRPGSSGKIFFNIQGSANGEFASFGVADFDLGEVTDNVLEVTDLTLTLTQSNAGFTTNGLYAVYLTDAVDVSIQPDDSPLTFQGGDGIASIDPLLTNLQLLATFQFVEDDDGALDTYTLDLSAIGNSLTDAINAGETLRLVLAPEEPVVAATYAGQGNFDGPAPTLGIEYLTDEGEAGLPLAIYEIQGAAHTSPFAGELVETTGVVTAVGLFDAVGNADLQGFFLQDPAGDGDIATSDAVFVASDATVAVGDEVTVTGTVEETGFSRELPYTRIGSGFEPATVTVLSSGNPLPAPVIIGQSGRVLPTEVIDDDNFGEIPGLGDFDPTTDGADFFESLEGMLVTVEDAVAISNTNRFGEIFVVTNGGAGATGISERGTLNISPDDFNPEKVQIDPGRELEDPALEELPFIDTGALLGNVTGVIGYDFGNFQVQPTESVVVTPVSLEPQVTDVTGDDDTLTVVAYNVLNLDPNDEDGDEDTGVESDQDVANGRFDAIAEQIVVNLATPDVVALQEIQDNNGTVDDGTTAADETLQLLVDSIVAAGGPTYAFIDNPFVVDGEGGGVPGGNIRTAFLYNPERVDLVADSVRTVEDLEAFAGSRLPLIATFVFNGEEVTLVNNHFSSKGGSAPIFGTEQPFEALQEDPSVNGSLDERQRQSAEVQNFVTDLLTADPTANVVVLGDLNEFEFVSPVLGLEAIGLENLTNRVAPNERYTFNFQGNSQSLDHILVSDALAAGAAFDIVHVNSEFADLPTRASDHDPLIAGLTLGAAPGDLTLGFAGQAFGRGAAYDPETVTFTFASDAPGVGVLSLEVINLGDERSGVFFLTCTTLEAPGALTVRRIRRALRAGFRRDDVGFDNAANPRVRIGSEASPSVFGVPAGGSREIAIDFVGTGAGADELTCVLDEATDDGGFRRAGSIVVAVVNEAP